MQKYAPNFFTKFSLAGSSFFTDDWLPDPVNLQELAQGKTADLSGNIYESKLTPGQSYVIYTEKGMEIVKIPPKPSEFNAETSGYVDSSLYVRNISVYKSESIRTNMTFYGEARNTFFAEEKFPVYLIDAQGKIFAKETAVSTGQWSIPGWSRFSVQIHSLLPSHQACQVLFVPDPTSQDARTGARSILPVNCN